MPKYRVWSRSIFAPTDGVGFIATWLEDTYNVLAIFRYHGDRPVPGSIETDSLQRLVRLEHDFTRPVWVRLDGAPHVFVVSGQSALVFRTAANLPLGTAPIVTHGGIEKLLDREDVGVHSCLGRIPRVLIPILVPGKHLIIRAIEFSPSMGTFTDGGLTPVDYPFPNGRQFRAGPFDTLNFEAVVYKDDKGEGCLEYREKVPDGPWKRLELRKQSSAFKLKNTIAAVRNAPKRGPDSVRLFDKDNNAVDVDLASGQTQKASPGCPETTTTVIYMQNPRNANVTTIEEYVSKSGNPIARAQNPRNAIAAREWECVSKPENLITTKDDDVVLIPPASMALVYNDRGLDKVELEGAVTRDKNGPAKHRWYVRLLALSQFTISYKVRCVDPPAEKWLQFDCNLQARRPKSTLSKEYRSELESILEAALEKGARRIYTSEDLAMKIGQDVCNAAKAFYVGKDSQDKGVSTLPKPVTSSELGQYLDTYGILQALSSLGYQERDNQWITGLVIK